MSLPQQQPQVNITTGLDGKGALNMCGKEREWVRLGSDHFDLIGINSSLRSRSSFNIKKEHELGYQDTLGRPLTLLGILNYAFDIKRLIQSQEELSPTMLDLFFLSI